MKARNLETGQVEHVENTTTNWVNPSLAADIGHTRSWDQLDAEPIYREIRPARSIPVYTVTHGHPGAVLGVLVGIALAIIAVSWIVAKMAGAA